MYKKENSFKLIEFCVFHDVPLPPSQKQQKKNIEKGHQARKQNGFAVQIYRYIYIYKQKSIYICMYVCIYTGSLYHLKSLL